MIDTFDPIDQRLMIDQRLFQGQKVLITDLLKD